MYLSTHEIVDHIIDNNLVSLTAEEFQDPFVKIELGRWIRNAYDLWHEDNPHTAWGVTIIDGIDHTRNHPDAVADKIIKKLQRRLS